jgi:hypothetical protein
MAKRADVPSLLEKTAQKLERRLVALEAISKESHRVLELQSRRMAAMQADLNRLLGHIKRGE